MVSVKNTDNQIVVPPPILWRVLGWFCVTGGIGLLIIMEVWGDLLTKLLGLLMLFPLFTGVYLLGYRTEVIFDNVLGNITIRKLVGPLAYRTRHISKRDLRSATANRQGDQYDAGEWTVWLRIEGTIEPVKISNVRRSSANYLADRINAFVRFE